ncbi:serine/threonine-protein kinase [Haloferula sargassicola]|uniref:Serine/threonine-protein kinase PknD n=1 Tax=Haloferula sargassicola TaxID=490096 RepID=A0ABP9UPZ5_9BACT
MSTKTCPLCRSSIPADAPGGLCPACVLRDAGEPPARPAPSLEEIAAAFPQLEVLGLIGVGGMGFVYKVRQPSLDRTVALKVLCPDLGRDPAFAERFAREARTLGKLQHPNIVTIFEHGESGGFFYLLMEYVDGVNLRQAMRAGRFTPEQALAIVPGICDALQAAHAQGIWHRDIKPENILLDRDGRVKIVDFGIARLVGDPQRDFTLTFTGSQLGSAAYMAPEQVEKPHTVDHRADIYSLGVVIYEMLTGELPLGRFPLPSQRAEVNARIDEIVLRTLEKERELRQQSATEVRTQFEGAGDIVPPPPTKPRGKSGAKGVLIGCSVALVLGLLVLLVPAVLFFSYRASVSDQEKQLEAEHASEVAEMKARDLERMKLAEAAEVAEASETDTPEKAVEDALRAAKSGDSEALRQRLSRELLEKIDKDGNGPGVLRFFSRLVFERTRWVDGPWAKVDLSLPQADGGEIRIDLDLEKQQETWRFLPENRHRNNHELFWLMAESGEDGEEKVVKLKGAMGSEVIRNGGYHALQVHIAGHPILMVVGREIHRVELTGSADRVEGSFNSRNIRVSDVNRATIDQADYDLAQGRVFLQRDDGTFRQVAARPERILSGDELKEFINELSPE